MSTSTSTNPEYSRDKVEQLIQQSQPGTNYD